MPHVSNRKLNKKLYQKLFSDLIKLQVGLSESQFSKFTHSLLTPTEQVMVTKRCAAVVMFAEGYSTYRVSTVLNLSKSTALRLRSQYEEGELDGIAQSFRLKRQKQRDQEAFFETLEKILRLGMPSMGKDRWKSLPK